MLTKDLAGTAVAAVAVFLVQFVLFDGDLTSSLAVALLLLAVGAVAAVRRGYRARHPDAEPGELLRKDLLWATVGTAFVVAVLIVLFPTEPSTIAWLGGIFVVLAFGLAFGSWVSARARRTGP